MYQHALSHPILSCPVPPPPEPVSARTMVRPLAERRPAGEEQEQGRRGRRAGGHGETCHRARPRDLRAVKYACRVRACACGRNRGTENSFEAVWCNGLRTTATIYTRFGSQDAAAQYIPRGWLRRNLNSGGRYNLFAPSYARTLRGCDLRGRHLAMRIGCAIVYGCGRQPVLKKRLQLRRVQGRLLAVYPMCRLPFLLPNPAM